MIIPTVTPLYAGLLALFLVYLSFQVIFRRRDAKVSIGDGDDSLLNKRIRVHANFIEYAPMGLILLLMAELQGAPLWVCHILGIMLLAGRIMHAKGLAADPQIVPLRKNGMIITFMMLTFAAIANIAHAIF